MNFKVEISGKPELKSKFEAIGFGDIKIEEETWFGISIGDYHIIHSGISTILANKVTEGTVLLPDSITFNADKMAQLIELLKP